MELGIGDWFKWQSILATYGVDRYTKYVAEKWEEPTKDMIKDRIERKEDSKTIDW